MSKVTDFIGYIIAFALLLPLLPIYVVGIVTTILSYPIMVIAVMLMLVCKANKSTILMIVDTIFEVFNSPLKLFKFASNGLIQSFGKENE